MYIDRCRTRGYARILLRDSYRIDGKNRHHTILNLSKWPEKDLRALELALKHKDDLEKLTRPKDDISLAQGVSVGAVHLLLETARRLGIEEALGKDRNGRLAMWQVIARVMDQGSRLSAVRLADSHACHELLGLGRFDENDLYKNLAWLHGRQAAVEDILARRRYGDVRPELFLYDVTSSYFEGDCNELAAFGYNRDGKRGKKQIVVGLLCDGLGNPVTIEVFAGNTADMKTVGAQIEKLSSRFGGAEITLVGDRGMIKGPQMKDLEAAGVHYITAITKPQIEKLLEGGILQMELFDKEVAEVVADDGTRYVCRRNPYRAGEMEESRERKFRSAADFAEKMNAYLALHPRALPDKAANKVKSKTRRLKIEKWAAVSVESGKIILTADKARLAEVSALDGCYALKTDLRPEHADKHVIHSRYKDLALVEQAFRTSKTVELEMRPIFLRRGDSTRAHAFVVMLACSLTKELARRWNSLDMTVQEGLDRLKTLCATDVLVKGAAAFSVVPDPRRDAGELFRLAGVKPPKVVKKAEERADTKVKLNKRR